MENKIVVFDDRDTSGVVENKYRVLLDAKNAAIYGWFILQNPVEKGETVIIRRGLSYVYIKAEYSGIIFSRNQLSRYLKINPSRVRRGMDLLKNLGYLEWKSFATHSICILHNRKSK